MIRLTVFRTDGPPLVGVYPYLCALARLDFARTLPNFSGFDMGAA
jgi:hypothetical protein